MEHASPAHSSSTPSIRHSSTSAGTSLDEHGCRVYLVQTVESLPAVAQSNFQSRRKVFPQHKRLWRIARRICPIYAAISLHSSQQATSVPNTSCANFKVSSQLVTANGHDLFAMALQTPDLPGQNQLSPKVFTILSTQRQCPSCSVKLHQISIQLVCNLYVNEPFQSDKPITITSRRSFMSLSFEQYCIIHTFACA